MPVMTNSERTALSPPDFVWTIVNNNGLEIRHQAGQTRAAAQGLHTGHHGRGGMLIPGCLHDAQGQGRIDEVQFLYGLLDELIAVRENERPTLMPLDQEGKDNGF